MNRSLKFLLISNAVFVFAGSLFVPLYAIFVVELGGGIELAGSLVALEFTVAWLASLAIVRLRDRQGLSIMLLKVSFFMRSLVWLILGFWPSIYTLIVVQIIHGMTQAIGSPAFNSLVSEHLDNKQHIREWGTWELIKSPITATASIFGGFIASQFGFELLFVIMGLIGLFSLGVLYATPSDTKKRKSRNKS